MHYVGVDLHKQTISVCVVIQAGTANGSDRQRTRFAVRTRRRIMALLRRARAVPSRSSRRRPATSGSSSSSSPWPQRCVLAHPRKLRVIAESTKKTDKLDAQTLAEFLALDMIPAVLATDAAGPRASHAGAPAVLHCSGGSPSAKNKLRRIVADYNADIRPTVLREAGAYLAKIALSDADRFPVDLLFEELDQQRDAASASTASWPSSPSPAPIAEQEARPRPGQHSLRGRRDDRGRAGRERATSAASARSARRPPTPAWRRNPPKRRPHQATGHHQRGLAAVAEGTGADGLAAGE